VARALSVVGDRWTLLVLREAFFRTRRFEDFQARTGAPRPVLAERLRSLVDDGVLDPVTVPGDPVGADDPASADWIDPIETCSHGTTPGIFGAARPE